MTQHRSAQVIVDVVAGLLHVGPSLVKFDPHTALPLASCSVDSFALTGDIGDTPLFMALLREMRRSLRFDGIIDVGADLVFNNGTSLVGDDDEDHDSGDGPPELSPKAEVWAAADRVARYCGLGLVEEPSQGRTRFRRPTPTTLPADPLVSIMIPGYRVQFLDEALTSACGQSWPNIEILVGDDCPTEALHDLVQRHAAADPRVRYIGRASQRGGRPNLLHLLSEAQGHLLKFLNDDDVLAPACVERMARTLQELPAVTLVTSHRQPIDVSSRHQADLTCTGRRVGEDSLIDGASAAADLIEIGYNWLGEPSTTMFRADAMDTATPFGVIDRPAPTSGDLALWLKLLSRGDLVYLTDTLSYFRQHEGQRQRQPEFVAVAQAGRREIDEAATSIGLTARATDLLVARPLGERPWWSPTARELYRSIDLETADETLDALERELPDDVNVALLRAQVALANNDPTSAVTMLDGAAERHPDSVAVVKLIAIALLQLGAVPLAHRMLWLASKLCPHDNDTIATIEALTEAMSEPVPG